MKYKFSEARTVVEVLLYFCWKGIKADKCFQFVEYSYRSPSLTDHDPCSQLASSFSSKIDQIAELQ